MTLSGLTARTEDRTLVMAGREAEEPEGMMDCATPILAALMVMLYNPALATFAKRHWNLQYQYPWSRFNCTCTARFDDQSCQLYAPMAPFQLSAWVCQPPHHAWSEIKHTRVAYPAQISQTKGAHPYCEQAVKVGAATTRRLAGPADAPEATDALLCTAVVVIVAIAAILPSFEACGYGERDVNASGSCQGLYIVFLRSTQ